MPSSVGGESAPATSLHILPGEITLTGPQSWQRLIVEQSSDGRYTGQVTEDVSLVSSDPGVVQIDEGVARPVGDGEAEITVENGGRIATAKVKVVDFDSRHAWSFRNHVESVLAKFGCSSGACHGAQAGKNGFKLSLRGYDPLTDYHTLTRQARGRRIVPSDPGRSLMLLKPTAAVPHKGGLRFDVGSLDYRVIAEWIADGAPAPRADDPRLVRLEILPRASVLRPEVRQQLIVRAHFSDGRAEDVTRWAKYTASDLAVADVDAQGLVSVMGYGEGAVTAWYASKVVIATVSSPFDNDVDPQVFADAPRRNFIDEAVLEKLQDLNLPPSPPAADGEFIRRAFVDTIGVLPTAEETKAFLADESPDKRDKLIEHLLGRGEFVDYWSYKWADLLLVNSAKLPPAAMWSYYNWIRNNVAADTPWDEFARRLVTATGSTLENGATNYFLLHQDALALSETTSLAFLGMSINCAKCHNHPLEKWTNDQYYAMANLFSRVRTKDAPGDGNATVFAASDGDLVQPLTGRPRAPQPLDGEAIEMDSPEDRRAHLADWLTSVDNPYFARAIVNRVWANFYGVGLVENVDDMRLTNPPSNEKLLAEAAAFLAEKDFDLKSLMRVILQSHTYQRSSQPLPENAAEGRFYSRYYPRRMMAEAMLDAISQVTASPTQFGGYPSGWRAMQLPDSSVDSYFLKTFGRPERVITCECERTEEPSMVQILHISNGKSLNDKLKAGGNRIERLLASGATDEQIVEDAYLAALSRQPTESEREDILEVLSTVEGDERRLALEDLYWGILSSREFLFNH
jgi:hypothetical protein